MEIENLKALKSMMVLLANSTFTNISKLYNNLSDMNLKVGKSTISNYLEYLEDSFIVFRVRSFSKSLKTSEIFEFKPFFIDSGLLNLLISRCDSKYFENLVFVELMRRFSCFNKSHEIFYYKTKDSKEIDFVVKSLGRLEL